MSTFTTTKYFTTYIYWTDLMCFMIISGSHYTQGRPNHMLFWSVCSKTFLQAICINNSHIMEFQKVI